MASADLREDLSCSICLNIYTDPVTLRCGHNFCRVCIDRVLDTQEASGGYSCPECREEFRKRPALRKNITLCNITEKMSPAPTPQGPAGTFCTHCIHAHVPAAKSCLHCEAHLCADHLKIHSKSPEHVLLDPSTSMENRRCSIHREPLRYFCINDKVCICVSCSLAGQHRGHWVDMLDEASRKKKEDLRKVSEKLISKFQEVKEKIEGLQKQWRKSQEKTADFKKRATTAFRDLRSFVEHLEKKVLAEISQQEEQGSQLVSNMIHELEAKRDELARKMLHVEKLFNVVDPLIVLQDLETSRSDFRDMKPIDDMNLDITHKKVYAADELDESPITAKVQTLSLILKDLKCGVTREPTKLSLTKNPACHCIKVSDDLKPLSVTIGGRCDYKLAMSTTCFSSGTHYWEVEVGGRGSIGVCYASLINEQSKIEKNRQSWWLSKSTYDGWSSIICLTTIHDNYESRLPTNPSSNKFRIYLNYDAGRISFYELCTPTRHLYTFTAKFTEPLHAAFYGYDTTFKIN